MPKARELAYVSGSDIRRWRRVCSVDRRAIALGYRPWIDLAFTTHLYCAALECPRRPFRA
jgi:hypothetical protein